MGYPARAGMVSDTSGMAHPIPPLIQKTGDTSLRLVGVRDCGSRGWRDNRGLRYRGEEDAQPKAASGNIYQPQSHPEENFVLLREGE